MCLHRISAKKKLDGEAFMLTLQLSEIFTAVRILSMQSGFPIPDYGTCREDTNDLECVLVNLLDSRLLNGFINPGESIVLNSTS